MNLGRLSIARVFASGGDGGPDAKEFYGVRNAFDGGSNIINGLNYSSWSPASQQGFVIVRFSQPVTVAGVVVEGSRSSWVRLPESFTVQIRSGGSRELFVSPAIPLNGLRTVYAAPRPVERVREVMLLFQARLLFDVEEIEILGPPPSGVNLSPVTPLRDPALVRGSSRVGEAEVAARKALIRTLAGMRIAEMRAARSAADRAPDSARKAHAWFEVNRAADQLAELLLNDGDLRPLAEEASALGVTVAWCEPGDEWFAKTQGYQQYLRIWPDGPQADDAWWMGRVPNGPRCGDFEGTRGEYEGLIQQYSEFLKRFPTSLHAPEARWRLQDIEKELKALGPK
ncbi:MAG: hypothetical protein ABSD56_13480 [Bryobacteraceae bacterium]